MDPIEQAILAIRQKRAELTLAKQNIEIKDRELATAERVMMQLQTGESLVAEAVAPKQPELPGATVAEMPMRWDPLNNKKTMAGESPADRALIDGLALPPISPAEADVFRALVKLRKQHGQHVILYSVLDKEAGRPSFNFLKNLERAGYVKNYGVPGNQDWWPMAKGKIQISQTSRTKAGEPVPLSEAVAIISGATDQGEAALEPPKDAVEIDDLSKSGREVLCVIVELGQDGGAVSETEIGSTAEIDATRLAGVLTRLSVLECVVRDTGGWVATELGKRLAKEIAADELVSD